MQTPQNVFDFIIEAMAAEGDGKGQDVDPGAASKGEGP